MVALGGGRWQPEGMSEDASNGLSIDPPRLMVFRTGADQPWDPEDLAVAKGQDPTPKNVERARRELAELGPAAIEKCVP
jgi:hypothetical protein